MELTKKQKIAIDKLLKPKFEKKVQRFKVSKSMDFNPAASNVIPKKHRRIMATVHSWSTFFGQSIWESLAETIATNSNKECHTQWHAPKRISKDRVNKIDEILRENIKYFKSKKKEGKKPDVENEIEEILAIPNENLVDDETDNIVDIYFDNEYLIDSKTVTINKDLWIDLKKKTLKWVARMDRPVKAVVGLPYNPKGTKPYSAIGSEIMELDKNLLVGENYWSIYGNNIFQDLAKRFKKLGTEYFNQTLKKASLKT